MKNKQYKPGQLITINHKVYRVTKTKDPLGWCCRYCAAALKHYGVFCGCLNKFKRLCNTPEKTPLMPMDCYFERIK